MIKTNAMRILENKNIEYKPISYEVNDGLIDGVSVAKKINKESKEVYKTLVGQGRDEKYIFIIPVDKELDLKKAASAAGEKKVELIKVKDITKITGYVKGGCSPIGMKKDFPSFIQKESKHLEDIVVSAGKIGVQIQLNPKDLSKTINASLVDLIK